MTPTGFAKLQVRHAQGIHNVAGEKDFNAYMSQDLFDAQLTPLGWSQVSFFPFVLHHKSVNSQLLK